MKVNTFVLFFLVLVIISCNTEITNDELKAIIIKNDEIIRTTLKNGDPSFVINMHTDDAIQFMPDGTEIAGKDRLREFYNRVATSRVDIESIPTTVEILSSDIAMEVGIFISTTITGEKNKGKYVLIWKKVDSDWKIYKAIDQAKIIEQK
ncbi:hypothetical protein BH10BAC4_BH10BAC4_06870 [soil metagenome]